MNTNKETKVKTRIRHIYSSREAVIHNLFYRDEYSIYRASDKALTASYDYLFKGDHDSVDVMSKKDLINDWQGTSYLNQWKAETCEAVVNRNEHILVVSSEALYSWIIIHSVPNTDWNVYIIDGKIDNPLIATKRYRIQLLKRAATYLLKRCLYDISFRFKLAYTDKYYCGNEYVNADPVYRFSTYHNDFYFRELIAFLKYNAIGDTSTIYKNRLIKEFTIYIGGNWSNNQTFTLRGSQIPTIKNLLEDNIFDAKHQNIINMKMFYSKYCRGTSLNYTWSQVKSLWNTRIKKYNDTIVDRIGNKELKDVVTHYIKDVETRGKEPLWQDVLLSFYNEINNKITRLNYDNRKKSDENRRNAIEEYYKTHKNGKVTIKDWRDGKAGISYTRHAYVEVKVWKDATIKRNGYWIRDTIVIDDAKFAFPNTQLRLVKEEEQAGVPKYKYYVETSKHCQVTLDDAIRLYHIFEKVKEMKKDKTNYFIYNFSNRNIRLGYYQLRSIKYCEKVTDEKVSLHKDEWVVIVGCHHLWIDDFMDFVRYYHLEDKFGINKHNLPLKIQM